MFRNKMRCILLLAACATLAGSWEAAADGVIVPVQPLPEPVRLGHFYSVKYHRVKVEIQDQAVTTWVEQAFINETDRSVEVQYLFPIPRNAAIHKFSLIVDGKEMEGRILPRDEARRIYESIVRRQRDPALLEYVDQGMFQTNVFPLPPRGERVVKLSYTELLTADGDRLEYRYPLNTEKFSHKVLEEVRIDFDLKSNSPVKTVYSPTHDFKPRWDGNQHVSGHWSDENVRPANDFRLFWTLSEDRVGATLFSYRPHGGEDGFFLILASPQMDLTSQKPIPKNLILVLDISGSMTGEKIEQARGAARFITDNLNPEDRFNLILYNSTVDPLWDELHPCSDQAKREVLDRIAQIHATGSTDIHAALMLALQQLPRNDRPSYLIFLTDGLPTAGVTDINQILEAVQSGNTRKARLFAFGVGFDVNTLLLDRLGADNSGMADYVPPKEDIEAKVSSFYAKIQNPALTEPSLDFASLRVRDVFPQKLPDLFYGGQLILAGRYRDWGSRAVTLTGRTPQGKSSFRYDLTFAERTDAEEFAFVARLWAQRKIGWLIEQIRLHGQNQELVNEVVDLSTRYGIMTQYTSFLADEDQPLTDVRMLQERARKDFAGIAPMTTGSGAVSQSQAAGEMQALGLTAPEAGYRDAGGNMVKAERVKIIGAKTFYLKGGEWVDAVFKEGMKPVVVKQFSEEFFELARKSPTQAQYLTFAPDQIVVAVIEGVAYRIEAGS